MNTKERLAEIKLNINKLKKEAKQTATKFFSEETKRLFKQFPILVNFSWNQYTPYFNDGDACTFSSNHRYFNMVVTKPVVDTDSKEVKIAQARKTLDEIDEDYSLDIEEDYDPETEVLIEEAGYYCDMDRDYAVQTYVDAPGSRKIAQAIKEVLGVFDNDDFEDIFGDHVKVVVTAKGSQAEDYEHD